MEATQETRGTAQDLQERLSPHLQEARKNLTDLNAKTVKFIREHPGTCLLGALAVGFVVGRIASRR